MYVRFVLKVILLLPTMLHASVVIFLTVLHAPILLTPVLLVLRTSSLILQMRLVVILVMFQIVTDAMVQVNVVFVRLAISLLEPLVNHAMSLTAKSAPEPTSV